MPGKEPIVKVSCELNDSGMLLVWYINGKKYDLPVNRYDKENRSFIYVGYEVAKIVKYDNKDILIYSDSSSIPINSLIEDQQVIAELEAYGLKWYGMRR